MAERLVRLDDAGLEAALRDLGRELAWPAAPDLPAAVSARVRAMPAPGRPWWSLVVPRPGTIRRSVLLAAAALLLLVVAAAAVRFGVPGVRFVFEGPAPSAAVSPSAGASPAPLGSSLLLGRHVELEEARAAVDFPVLVPADASLGAPDAVYLDESIPDGHVALVWRERPGIPAQGGGEVALMLAEFRGRADRDFFEKMISGSGTTIEAVTVDGATGWWLEGDPHILFFLDTRGEVQGRESRLVGNVLLWERDGVSYRLESALGLEESLRIAESLG